MMLRKPAMKKTKNSSTDSKLNMPAAKKRKLSVKTGGNSLPKTKKKNAEEPHKKFALYAQKSFQPMKIWKPPLKMKTGATTNQSDVEEASAVNSTSNITSETRRHNNYEESWLFSNNTGMNNREQHKKLSTRPCVAEDQLHHKVNTCKEDLANSEFLQQNFDANPNFEDAEKQNQSRREDIEREIVSSSQSKQNTTITFLAELEDKEFSENVQENQIKNENDQIPEKGFQENTHGSQIKYDNEILKLERKEFQENVEENQIKYKKDQKLKHEKKEFREKAKQSQENYSNGEPPSLKPTYSQEENKRDKLNTTVKMTQVSWQSDREVDLTKKMNSFSEDNNENSTTAESNFLQIIPDQNYEKTDDFKIQLQDKKLNFTNFNNEKPDDTINKNIQNCGSVSMEDTQKTLRNDKEASIDENNTNEESSSDDELDNYISKTIEKYMNKDKLELKLKDMKSFIDLSDSSLETVILSPKKIEKPKLQPNKEDHLNHLYGEKVQSNNKHKSKISVKLSSYDSEKKSYLENDFPNKATYLVESNTYQWKNDAMKSQKTFLATSEEKPTVFSDFTNYLKLDASEKTVLEQGNRIKFLENHLGDAGCHKEDSTETKTKDEEQRNIKNNDETCPEKDDYIMEFHNDKETDLFLNIEENDLFATSTYQCPTSNFFQQNSFEGDQHHKSQRDLNEQKTNSCIMDTKLKENELGNLSNLGTANLNCVKMIYQNLELLKSKETERKKQNLKNQKEPQHNSFKNGLMANNAKHEEKIDSEDVTYMNAVPTNDRYDRQLSLTNITPKEQECAQQSVMVSSLKSEVEKENICFPKILEKTGCDNKIPNKTNICKGTDMLQYTNPFYLKSRFQPPRFLRRNESSNKPGETKKKLFCTFTDLYEKKHLTDYDRRHAPDHVESSTETNRISITRFNHFPPRTALEFPQKAYEKSSLLTNKESPLRQNQVKIHKRLHSLKELIDHSKKEREKKTDSIRDVVSQTNTLVHDLIGLIEGTKH